LFIRLKQKLAIYPNVQLINVDFLKYQIPAAGYKVFANIPFNITAAVIKKLLSSPLPPTAAFLVVQKEAAEKFCGLPKETQFSIFNKPWFELEIVRSFRKTDFEPMPSVDTVLLKIIKRPESLVKQVAKENYIWFVQYGFNRWRANLGKNFKNIFTYKQWRRLAHDLKFQLKAQPTNLTFNQWLGIFNFYLKTVLK
ncbi:23S ribosomal RNA methyltransferase Erm, partial [Microgenomates group bacterium]|nr:23S ribosomal RNA methyltransferase Erm [Microgenomates group bacterium]